MTNVKKDFKTLLDQIFEKASSISLQNKTSLEKKFPARQKKPQMYLCCCFFFLDKVH
jgi:hypothetical protein